MSNPILIIGRSGTGKSRSIKNFEPGKVAVLNTSGKLLPFFEPQHDVINVPALVEKVAQPGEAKPLKADIIRSWLENHKEEYKTVVVDDYGFALFEIYRRFRISEDERLSNKFEPFDIILDRVARQIDALYGDNVWDRIVFIIMHEETDAHGNTSPLVQGKMVNDKYVLEGHVTMTLQSAKVNGEYVFYTNNGNPAKSPEGLFEGETIPNDLAFVDRTIREKYRWDEVQS